MNKLLTLAGIALTTITLAACSPGINEGIGHHITFDSTGMTVHAIGRPGAHIGKDGSIAIGDRAIDVTPAQRVMLQRYYRQARVVMISGETMGKEGVQMATHSIGAAIRSIFHGDSASADKQLDARSNQIENAAGKLCSDIQALDSTQKTIANGIPSFAPYAAANRTECTVTSTITIRDGNIAVARSSSAGAARATPARPESSSVSTSGKP